MTFLLGAFRAKTIGTRSHMVNMWPPAPVVSRIRYKYRAFFIIRSIIIRHFSLDLRMSKTTMRLSTSDRTALWAYLATEFNRWVEDLLSWDELPLVGSAVLAMKQPQPRRGNRRQYKTKTSKKTTPKKKTSPEEDKTTAPAAPAPEDQRPAPAASTPEEATREDGWQPRAASGAGDPWTPARLLPSLASVLGPPPRRHRRRASSVTTARATDTPPALARDHLSVPSAAGSTGAQCALTSAYQVSHCSTTATCAMKTTTEDAPASVVTNLSQLQSPSPPHRSSLLMSPRPRWTPF